MREQYCACTLSKGQRVSTASAIFVATMPLLIVIAVLAINFRHDVASLCVILGIFGPIQAVICAVLVILRGHAPKGYLVAADGLSIVRRNGKKILLQTQELNAAKACEPEILKGLGRDWGAGGYFGNWGDFSCPALGQFRGYWTNPNLVVVRTTRKGYYEGTFLLSPDDRDQFLSCMDIIINSADF